MLKKCCSPIVTLQLCFKENLLTRHRFWVGRRWKCAVSQLINDWMLKVWTRHSADRAQTPVAAWPPRTMAGLTLLPAGDRLKALPACPPTSPCTLFSFSRASEPPRAKQRRSAIAAKPRHHLAPSPPWEHCFQLALDSIVTLWSSSTSPLSQRVKLDAVVLLLRSGAPLPLESELSSPWQTTTGALSLLSLPSLNFPANPRCSRQA